MYDEDLVQEESILKWADEKENADEKDKESLKQAEQFLQVCSLPFWLFIDNPTDSKHV